MLCFITGYVMLYYRTYYVILYNMLCLCYVLYNKVSNSCILIGPYLWSIRGHARLTSSAEGKKFFFFQNGLKFWNFGKYFAGLGEQGDRNNSCRGCV